VTNYLNYGSTISGHKMHTMYSTNVDFNQHSLTLMLQHVNALTRDTLLTAV